jgi:phosphoribosylanthranilate isomerase
MKSRPLIKIWGLTRQEDADLAVELGADALGFVFEPTSKRSIHDKPEALQIPLRLGPYVMCVAVLGPYRPCPPQFHLVQCIDNMPEGFARPSLMAIRITEADTVESVLDQIGSHSAVLLDAFASSGFGGTGKTFDWALAAEVNARTTAKIVLAGGLTPDNVQKAIEVVQPYAVDVSGGVESEPGIKDHAKLRAFIKAVRN